MLVYLYALRQTRGCSRVNMWTKTGRTGKVGQTPEQKEGCWEKSEGRKEKEREEKYPEGIGGRERRTQSSTFTPANMTWLSVSLSLALWMNRTLSVKGFNYPGQCSIQIHMVLNYYLSCDDVKHYIIIIR